MPSISERKAKLQEQLAKLERKEEKEVNGRFIVIGRAVADKMEEDDEFKSAIMSVLDEQVSKNPDRELVGLEKRASNRGRPRKTPDAETV